MVFMQVLTGSFAFPFNCRFKSLRFTLNAYYLIIFWLIGCLMLDPVMFVSYHL